MTVSIAGGGIGGLATALSLHHVGIDCDVFESVDRIDALGVGINLLPHAVKELDALGLLDEDRAPDGLRGTALHEVISPEEILAVTEGYRTTAGFGVDELNQRPSLADLDYCVVE